MLRYISGPTNYSTLAGWVQQTSVTVPERIEFAQLQVPSALPTLAQKPTTAMASVELEVRFSDGTRVRGNKVKELAALVRALRA